MSRQGVIVYIINIFAYTACVERNTFPNTRSVGEGKLRSKVPQLGSSSFVRIYSDEIVRIFFIADFVRPIIEC